MASLGSPEEAGVQNVGPIGSSDDIEEFKDINFDINVIDQTQHIEPGQIKMEKGTCVQARIVEENVLGSYPLFVKNEVKSQKTELPQKLDEELPEACESVENVVVPAKPEDFFEANSKSDKASEQVAERSKSCKHGSSKVMVCPECGVNVHKCEVCKSAHRTFHKNQRQTVCNECGIDVAVKYLNRHMKKIHPEKRSCEFSGCDFKSLYTKCLREHFNRIHLNIPTEKSKICSDCGKAFVDSFRLKCHINADHLKLRPYKCKQCDKSFGRHKHLWSHMDVHKETDAYTCPTCGRGFRNNGAFYNHKKLHRKSTASLVFVFVFVFPQERHC